MAERSAPDHGNAGIEGQQVAPTLTSPVATSAPSAAVPVNYRIGHFVVLHTLGRGGMGVVYAAYDERLDRKVALKLLHHAAPEEAGHRLRMLREAQAMARVSHSHVVQVFEVGELENQIFIAMEFIEGVPLRVWQEAATRNWKEILRVYRGAGQGLLAAHRVGLVHRDFKPDNVLVDGEGRSRVLDFGLARLQADSPATAASAQSGQARQSALQCSLTMDSVIAGTPGYMSPEQFQGMHIDHRSDQFSFCVALYEALYHRRPFAGHDYSATATEVIAGNIIPPPQDSEVPLEVWRALERGMATDPAQRFPSLAELLQSLAVDTEKDPAGGWQKRMQLTAVSVVAVACVAAVFLLGHRHRGVTMSFYARSAPVPTAVVGLGMYVFRGALLRNAFHRGLLKLILLNVLLVGVIRITAWKLDLRVEQYAPIDSLIMAGLLANIAMRYFSGLWWVVAFLLLGATLSVLFSGAILWTVAVTIPLVPLSVAYSWNRAAQAARDSADSGA